MYASARNIDTFNKFFCGWIFVYLTYSHTSWIKYSLEIYSEIYNIFGLLFFLLKNAHHSIIWTEFFTNTQDWQLYLYWHQRFYYMKTKKCDKMLLPVNIEPGIYDSKSNTLFSEPTWYVLLRGSLNFCSWAT